MDLPDKPTADRFEDLPLEEQEAVRKAGQALHHLAYCYVAPITICAPSGCGFTGPVNNGTVSLVRFENEIFAVTAGHVINHMRSRRAAGEVVQLRIANIVIDVDGRRCWFDTLSDLAAIEVTPGEAASLNTFISELSDLYKVPVPTPGSYVVCVGFPIYLREDGSEELEYGALSSILEVTSAGDEYLVCQFARENWISAFGRGIPEPRTQLGGLSGGPVFAVGKLNYPLIGIITEFHSEFELLRIQSIRSFLRWREIVDPLQ